MNFWIFNPYEPLPFEGTVRLRYASLSEKLLQSGHSVTWWSADWSHVHKRRIKPYSSEWKLHNGEWVPCDEGASVYVHLIHVPAYLKNISLKRVWSHCSYAKGVADRADSHAAEHGKPDVILFSVPPMEAGRVALSLGQRFGAKVVLDVMDSWPDTLLLALEGEGRASRLWEVLRTSLGKLALCPYARMMRQYCREVDSICAQSAAFVQHAVGYGASKEIPIFYLSSDRVVEEKSVKENQPSTLKIVYLGSMGRVYDLQTLVEAVLDLCRRGYDLRLDLIGEGEQRVLLHEQVERAGFLRAITFHGFLEGQALQSLMSSASLGVIPMFPKSGVAIPYKASHYFSYGLPVVSSLDGELQEMITEYNCGTGYNAGDVSDLCGVLSSLSKKSNELEVMRKNALRLFESRFERHATHQRMAQWLVGLA